jgi:SecD/SecF fusion protein
MDTNPNGHSDLLFYATSNDTAKIGSLLREKEIRALYPYIDVQFMWSSTPVRFGENGDIKGYGLHAIRVPESGKAPVGGNDIDNAAQDYDQFGRIAVALKMTDKGTSRWAELTSRNLGKNIAIVMDGTVISSPTVQAIMNDGRAQITGNYTVEEAKEFAALLNAGSLPAPCSIIDESIVGPTLGQDNINAGMISFIIALAIVLLYMIFYYGQAGVVANITLLINILFILGSLASFGAVLTMAGIAGIVLTIGMSVDANVLIYERIREEISAGKGQKLAIKDGYAKALSSILDANLTTLLTAIILKVFGSGPIESFATTLIIGIFSSVFAAVVISRLIFESFNESKKNISFSTSMTKNAFQNLNFAFVSKRKLYYTISGILVVVAIGALATRGLKFGVEFTGGRSFEVKFENAANPEQIVNSLKTVMIADNGNAADVIVKTKESKNQVEIQTNYLQGVVNADTVVDSKLKEGLKLVESEMGTYSVIQSRSVSAVISDELKQSSYIAIILSLFVIFLYILFRFGKWQYGLGALVAMTHDVILVLGAFALLHGILPFNMDIDQAFIAAILTVVGYSINDTVVVFDRIREVLGLHKRKSRAENINDALNSTLSRTINTSMSTFVVLLTIFLLGGDAIRGFIFALMIGVIVGTYSSVCIATPAVVDLMKNEKEDNKK